LVETAKGIIGLLLDSQLIITLIPSDTACLISSLPLEMLSIALSEDDAPQTHL
jgi:hypothetical protein